MAQPIRNLLDARSWSKYAIDFTRRELSNGNCNAYEGVPGSSLRPLNCGDSKSFATDFVASVRSQPKVGDTPLGQVLCAAKIAMAGRAGNCGEHASVAFAYLYSNGIYPIGIYAYKDFDHAFVAVGADHLGEWLCLCDPWAKVFCDMNQIDAWKNHIWGKKPPDSDRYSVIVMDQPGSGDLFQQLTRFQNVRDAMDLS